MVLFPKTAFPLVSHLYDGTDDILLGLVPSEHLDRDLRNLNKSCNPWVQVETGSGLHLYVTQPCFEGKIFSSSYQDAHIASVSWTGFARLQPKSTGNGKTAQGLVVTTEIMGHRSGDLSKSRNLKNLLYRKRYQ